MDKEFNIENGELINNLLALAIMCNNNDTDNCDVTINTGRGDIICHIEFEGKLNIGEGYDI